MKDLIGVFIVLNLIWVGSIFITFFKYKRFVNREIEFFNKNNLGDFVPRFDYFDRRGVNFLLFFFDGMIITVWSGIVIMRLGSLIGSAL